VHFRPRREAHIAMIRGITKPRSLPNNFSGGDIHATDINKHGKGSF
jgi:hypothetical protein